MFRILVSLILINFLKSFDLISQENLVINGSFEEIISCPTSASQINLAIPWISGTINGTPDLYNTCASDFSVSVPYHYPKNYQWPKTGNAYSGFIAFDIVYVNEREFIGVHLLEPLLIGRCYRASCYVSRAKTTQPYMDVATNKIGFRFSTLPYSFWTPASVDNKANVFTDSIITDTTNWVEVTGTFIADSAYQYLSIGNFFTDSLTSWIAMSIPTQQAYYYIEDVSVYLDSCTNGIPLLNEQDIFIFPNPPCDMINIQGNFIQSVSLFDCLGRQLFDSNYKNESIVRLILGNYASGIYFLKIVANNKSIEKKINIQKI